MLFGIIRKLLPHVVLKPLRQVCDPAQRRLQVVRSNVSELIELPICFGGGRGRALGGVASGLGVGQCHLQLGRLLPEPIIELRQLLTAGGRFGMSGLLHRETASLRLGLAPHRQVARDFGKADQLTVGAAQRGDDYVGPETGAILAHPPAFVFEATFAARDVQFQLWKARNQQPLLGKRS